LLSLFGRLRNDFTITFVIYDDGLWTIFGVGGISSEAGPFIVIDTITKAGLPDEWASHVACETSVRLAILNSPRIVGRRVHHPHKGLARELAHKPELGIGPLHNWHEIKLEVTKPRDGEPHSDVITGRRALHFCRKHIRICHSGCGSTGGATLQWASGKGATR
jgi:hypothetical protein